MNITDYRAGFETQVNAASGNVAAAVASAALPAVAGRINFLTALEITGSGATAGLVVLATVVGLAGGTMTYVVSVPAGVLIGATPYFMRFSIPLMASAANTAITLSVPSFGAGNTNAAVAIHGFHVAVSG